jgi:Fe-Mn family superoxide dismutase
MCKNFELDRDQSQLKLLDDTQLLLNATLTHLLETINLPTTFQLNFLTKSEVKMEHFLSKLPFAKNALEPHMSEETLNYHYEKHHQSYVSKLNKLIKGSKFEFMPLEEVVLTADGDIFNNAAQMWNHTFFWNCLAPNKGGAPTGKLADAINSTWRDFEDFKKDFTLKASTNFGSGWTWLVLNKQNKLEVINTHDAQTPKTQGFKALLTLDTWEHAYYIDYRNERPKFIEAFWNLVNWDFVTKNLGE